MKCEHERWTEAFQTSPGEVSVLVRELSEGQGGERERGIGDRWTETMIYPDLGSTLRTMKGGNRGEVAVIMGKGERINVLTTMEDQKMRSGEINNIPWQIQSGRLLKINLQN